MLKNKSLAFTMAEILLSLTIIGVVAAITLPSLMANINERTWNTQRKALYARMSQAIAMMPQVGGYGTLTEDENGSVTEDTAAEAFLTEGLSKVLKINNICDSEHLADCGVVSTYTNMSGTQKSMATTLYELTSWYKSAYCYSGKDAKAAAFETQNGESLVVYYKRDCVSDINNPNLGTGSVSGYRLVAAAHNVCANFIYDLNGNKGPNTVGKDVGFITVFNSVDPLVVAPMPLSSNANNNTGAYWPDAIAACKLQDMDSRIPNIDELQAMLINVSLVDFPNAITYWSGTSATTDKAWAAYAGFNGHRFTTHKDGEQYYVRCIKR